MPVFAVYSYTGCGYYYSACKAVEGVSDASVSLVKDARSRGDYKAWLASGEGLAAKVPSSHRTTPSCFRDGEFVGGCSELRALLGREYNATGAGGLPCTLL